MADILFNCGSCEKPLVVDEAGAGLTVNCPVCNADIVIPPQSELSPQKPSTVKECPFCKNNIPVAAILCVICGKNLKTGDRN
jgi:DNA-directed RNA polymerase subunit RPC12/RpoP